MRAVSPRGSQIAGRATTPAAAAAAAAATAACSLSLSDASRGPPGASAPAAAAPADAVSRGFQGDACSTAPTARRRRARCSSTNGCARDCQQRDATPTISRIHRGGRQHPPTAAHAARSHQQPTHRGPDLLQRGPPPRFADNNHSRGRRRIAAVASAATCAALRLLGVPSAGATTARSALALALGLHLHVPSASTRCG